MILELIEQKYRIVFSPVTNGVFVLVGKQNLKKEITSQQMVSNLETITEERLLSALERCKEKIDAEINLNP